MFLVGPGKTMSRLTSTMTNCVASLLLSFFDILLFHRAILAYAGVTGEEFAMAAAEKMNYNSKRPDHNVNGTAEAEQNPAAELQGDCPSAAALRQYDATGPKFSAGT